MAVLLYKAGNSFKIRGIPCRVMKCNPFSWKHNLKNGWKLSPEECYPQKDEPELVEVQEVKKVAPAETSKGDDAIRKAAKAAGIKHYWNKSIERLINELKEQEDAE